MRQLRRNHLDLSVIVISGNADKQVVRTATELGVTEVLHKPVQPHDLVDVVQRALG
ncbi:response regulator [Stieleria sp.]|uniref:response regulator n=1 Tax=Stieleria sp. TaxID=2795976 RepID=UPI00356AAD9B